MKTTLRVVPALLLSAFAAPSFAAGFQLLEQNASGIGTAFAGTAVIAEDASTVFFNPAGMALLPQGKKNISVGVDAVKPSAKFSNSGSTNPALQSLGTNNGGDAGDVNFIPNAYVVLPISDRVSFGLGIGAPFGLKTEYDSNWIGRFDGIKSDVKTVNLNPSISYKASDTVALGFGLDYERLSGEFTSAVNYAAAVARASGGRLVIPGLEGTAKLSGSDTAWGYNLGAIFQLSPATRIGVSYRSAIKFHLTGNADFSRTGNPVVDGILGNAASPARGGAISADIKLPDVLTLSAMTHLNDKWDMVGDLAWTGWAKLPVLEFKYTSGDPTLSKTQENWRNTVRVAFGGIYKSSDTLKWKFGIAFDQTPNSDQFRTVRLPDSNRTWLSVGAQYALSGGSKIDWGYAHIFMKDAPINNNNGDPTGQSSGVVIGSYKNSVDMFGLQYSMAF